MKSECLDLENWRNLDSGFWIPEWRNGGYEGKNFLLLKGSKYFLVITIGEWDGVIWRSFGKSFPS